MGGRLRRATGAPPAQKILLHRKGRRDRTGRSAETISAAGADELAVAAKNRELKNDPAGVPHPDPAGLAARAPFRAERLEAGVECRVVVPATLRRDVEIH